MSEVLRVIQDRITAIDWKIQKNDNVRDYVEELNFLKELLGKLMMDENAVNHPNPMEAGIISDIFGNYARETPVYVYNCTPGTDAIFRFSRISSCQFNKEKGAIEVFYSGDDQNSYEDY